MNCPYKGFRLRIFNFYQMSIVVARANGLDYAFTQREVLELVN
jgi:hypothetical protein